MFPPYCISCGNNSIRVSATGTSSATVTGMPYAPVLVAMSDELPAGSGRARRLARKALFYTVALVSIAALCFLILTANF